MSSSEVVIVFDEGRLFLQGAHKHKAHKQCVPFSVVNFTARSEIDGRSIIVRHFRVKSRNQAQRVVAAAET